MATAHRSARAEIDLVEIWGHIANDDPLAADRRLDLIDEACRMLAEIDEIAAGHSTSLAQRAWCDCSRPALAGA